jgi:anaerobic selenocysteine-containing dehydrogenase
LRAIVAESGPDAVGTYMGNGTGFDSAGAIVALRFVRALASRSTYTALTLDCPAKPLIAELMASDHRLSPVVDNAHAGLVMYVGSNPVVSHGHTHIITDPVVHLREQTSRGEVWVIDPRRTETARLATRHLRPRPGTDYAILGYLVNELLGAGADFTYLREHATGVDVLAAAVAQFDVASAAAVTGIDARELAELVATIRVHGRVAVQTGTGTTMSAAANVTEWFAWSLQVVTGSLDRQGGCLFNAGFYQRIDCRPPVMVGPGTGPPSRPELPGRFGERPSVAIPDEIEAGQLRALLVFGGNPVSSLPDTARAVRSLRGLDVLAVFDIVENDVTSLATHVMPCTAPFERADISLTADLWSSRRVGQYTGPVVAPQSDRRPMWWWIAHMARRLGLEVLRPDPDRCDDDAVLGPVADASLSTFSTLQLEGVVDAGPLVPGWVTEQVLPEGRWRLAPPELIAQLGSLGPIAPLVLIPRRQTKHLNSCFRELGDRPDCLMHPADASKANVEDGTQVRVTGGDRTIVCTARVSLDIAPGSISVPHGFDHPNVNRITSTTSAVDPLTGMPQLGGLPVTLSRVEEGATDGTESTRPRATPKEPRSESCS